GALLIDTDMSALGLVLSARVSGEIARKATAAGVAWIATRSVPTTLALDIAQSAGIAIVARAPSRDAFVWHPLTLR
ncbi:MAG: formate dehydrogenase accessory sulfurtransferase FdhD, partial [Longimicrobiales bacterium]